MAVCLFCGCQGNTTALRNPFATPNRVPPPATRALQPGAAQPYYPGDPLPTTPAGPAAVLPPGVPGSIPPGGWNSSPQSSVTPTPNVVPASAQIALGPVTTGNESPVQVNADQQNLQFNPSQISAPGQGVWNPPQVATTSPSLPTPSQSVLPSSNQPTQFAVQQAGFEVPVAGSQFVEQSQVAQANVYQHLANAEPREVRIRTVKPPRVDAANGSTSGVSRDGFRPQGSRLINRSEPAPSNSATGLAVAPLQFGPVREDIERFGFDPQYQWLRGQIQYSQATGQWHLRYAPVQSGPVQGGPDQFGGQVLIENPHLLGGVQPGDFVQVRGRLSTQSSGAGTYTVSIVQRQRVQ